MSKHVIFFDGVCGLCNGFVDFVIKIDRENLFSFSPLQGEFARNTLSPSDVQNLSSIVVKIGDKTYRKSEAVIRVFQLVGGAWAPFGVLLSLPTTLRDKAYDLIASNRYRLFGKKETCRLPTPEERARFIL
jgi:predicted DCC family thiol-disulfide oxidoreductase YuxK